MSSGESKEGLIAEASAASKIDEEQEIRRSVAPKARISRVRLYTIVGLLIILGCGNFILLKICYSAYPARYSFFVNQGINFLYCTFGAFIVIPRIYTGSISKEMLKFPHKPFMMMGFLDSLGTFFTAMGTPGTPGSATPLLNQTLIPFTMATSLCILKSVNYHKLEVLGAAIILCGAVLSVMNQVIHPDTSGTETHWYCILFYLASNVPMACSTNYKERNFAEATLDVWYLTQWVSVYQFIVSFLYMPFLALPGFAGNDAAIPIQQPFIDFKDGFRCFLGNVDECEGQQTALLLVGYTVMNMMFNTLGLYLTQQASAVVCYITYALLLPVTTIMFSASFLGKYQESLSAWTFAGLGVVFIGFVIYQKYSFTVAQEEEKLVASFVESFAEASAEGTPINTMQKKGQSSFQERVIGMGGAHRFRSTSGVDQIRSLIDQMTEDMTSELGRDRAGSV